MSRLKYIQELRANLKSLPETEVRDIVADYDEHFEAGIRAGKTEDQIVQALGPAKTVAQGFLMNNLIKEVHATPSTVGRGGILLRLLMGLLILAPFNFFVLVGPFCVAVSLLIAGWAVPVTIAGVSFAALGGFFYAGIPHLFNLIEYASLFFLFLGMLGMSVVVGMLMIQLSRGFISVVANYIRWNINFINARAA